MLETLHTKMLGIAKSHHLPEINQTDLDDDLRILKAYQGRRLIWLLRTCGSTLVPIRVGADPIHITHWLFSNHGQRVFAFLIDTDHGSVEKITFAQAEKLIQQPPLEITAFMTPKEAKEALVRVLENGVTNGVWGVFTAPQIGLCDWEKWRNYFAASGNELMKSFMNKAIRRITALSKAERQVA